MQNDRVVSRPVFHALSNGALVFAVSRILCTGKWRKLFTETLLAFNLTFSAYMTQLTEEKCTNRRSLKVLFGSSIYLYLYMMPAFKRYGNTYEPVYMHAGYTNTPVDKYKVHILHNPYLKNIPIVPKDGSAGNLIKDVVIGQSGLDVSRIVRLTDFVEESLLAEMSIVYVTLCTGLGIQ